MKDYLSIDADGDGIPDVLQGKMPLNFNLLVLQLTMKINSTSIVHDKIDLLKQFLATVHGITGVKIPSEPNFEASKQEYFDRIAYKGAWRDMRMRHFIEDGRVTKFHYRSYLDHMFMAYGDACDVLIQKGYIDLEAKEQRYKHKSTPTKSL